MGTFIILAIIGFAVYSMVRTISGNNSNHSVDEVIDVPINIKFTTSFSSSPSFEREEKFEPIVKDRNNGWVLNPNAHFKLTLMNVDQGIAQEVRSLLDNEEIRDYKRDNMLIALFAEHNIQVKEIELYKKEYKEAYLSKIENLKRNSSEWLLLGEKDKEDLLIEFRQAGIASLYERADCDLEILFEYEPEDITIDDQLIKDYGFENIQIYLRYADNLDKVRVIPNDSYSRSAFESLAESGLAKRGTSLSKEDVLLTMTLKELNILSEGEFYRKKKAIDHILTLDNLDQKIGKHVSLRELFKLQPLPNKYDSLNLMSIARTWKYHANEVELLISTYRNSHHGLVDLRDNEFIESYSVVPMNKENPCPLAADKAKKNYSKNSPPNLPFHVGCSCYLRRKFN